jgi:hypothetical protein
LLLIQPGDVKRPLCCSWTVTCGADVLGQKVAINSGELQSYLGFLGIDDVPIELILTDELEKPGACYFFAHPLSFVMVNFKSETVAHDERLSLSAKQWECVDHYMHASAGLVHELIHVQLWKHNSSGWQDEDMPIQAEDDYLQLLVSGNAPHFFCQAP